MVSIFPLLFCAFMVRVVVIEFTLGRWLVVHRRT
jgi:hypothetical protein